MGHGEEATTFSSNQTQRESNVMGRRYMQLTCYVTFVAAIVALGSFFFSEEFVSYGDPKGTSISAGLFGLAALLSCIAYHWVWIHIQNR